LEEEGGHPRPGTKRVLSLRSRGGRSEKGREKGMFAGEEKKNIFWTGCCKSGSIPGKEKGKRSVGKRHKRGEGEREEKTESMWEWKKKQELGEVEKRGPERTGGKEKPCRNVGGRDRRKRLRKVPGRDKKTNQKEGPYNPEDKDREERGIKKVKSIGSLGITRGRRRGHGGVGGVTAPRKKEPELSKRGIVSSSKIESTGSKKKREEGA